MAVSPETRRRVRGRAQNRCEYCQCPGSHSTSPFAIEHIYPQARGGADEDANLVCSCGHCNGHKAAVIAAVDPQTGKRAPLFNPRTQIWKDHFAWSDDKTLIIGLTPTGRATVKRLKMNREETVNLRNVLRLAGLHPPADTD